MRSPQQQPAGKKAESACTLDDRHLQTFAKGRVRKVLQKGTRALTCARAHTHTHGTLATMTLVKRTSMHRNTTRTQERWSSMSYAAERKEESAFAVIWGGAALAIPIHAGRLRTDDGRLRMENTHRPDSARICSNPLTHASSPAAKALSFVSAILSRCHAVGAGTLSKVAMPVLFFLKSQEIWSKSSSCLLGLHAARRLGSVYC